MADPVNALRRGAETNPIALAWGMLPPNVRNAYASVPNALAELSPGAAVRDTVQASGETMNALKSGNGWGTAGGVAGMLAAAAGLVPGSALARKIAGTRATAVTAPQTPGAFPWAADRYPAVAPPVPAVDKTSGKQFLQKELSPEAVEFQKARAVIQKDIDAGNYTPYFDPAKRHDANVAKYPAREDTTAIRMSKAETQAKYDAIANDPAAVQRLDEAYSRGMKQPGAAGNWYQMGQLENEYIKEYGEKTGRLMFKERFADAMAATTGGADPTSNFLMSHYGNWLKAGGNAIPAASYEFPFPIGGRYAGNNMKQFDRMVAQGEGVTSSNPKRYNFSRNFLGDSKGATIDEQMSGLFSPGMQMPPPGTYGHFEGALNSLAKGKGVDPRWYQEVAWAGTKDAKTKGGYSASPMISHVNESVERTSRLTGLPPAEVVRRMVRGEIPMYGIATAAPAAIVAGAATREQNAATPGGDY